MRKVPPLLLLDAWRGLAALWVVMIHSCLAFVTTPGNDRFTRHPLYAFSLWGQLGVVIFFVISGYCVMGAAYGVLASGRTTANFIRDRVRRIYPPYWAACLLSVAIGGLITVAQREHLLPAMNHHAAGDQAGIGFWLTNLLLVHFELGRPALLLISWSLCYEVVFYAIVALLLLAARSCARRGNAAHACIVFQFGIFALTMISLAWLYSRASTCPFPLDRWYLFGLGALYFLMVAAETGAALWRARLQYALAVALALALAFWRGAPAFFELSYPSCCMQSATALIFLGVLYLLRPMDARLAHSRFLRPLLWLGTISYSIYLVHPFLLAFPDVLGRRLGFDGSRYWITYLMEIAVAILSGWIFHLLVERHFISSRQKRRAHEELGKPEPVVAKPGQP